MRSTTRCSASDPEGLEISRLLRKIVVAPPKLFDAKLKFAEDFTAMDLVELPNRNRPERATATRRPEVLEAEPRIRRNGFKRGPAAVSASLVLLVAGIGSAHATPAAPEANRAAAVQSGSQPSHAQPNDRPRHHEHLSQWFRQHESLTPAEQEKALRAEPGFSRLSPQKQERLIQRLRRLDAMPPQRRERTLQRMEAMEKLTHEQRHQVRQAMRQVSQMPKEERRKMRSGFHQLAHTPPNQRQALLNSPEFRSKFSDQERRLLGILMTIQPYRPGTPGAGGESK